jgi:hypothetical protein
VNAMELPIGVIMCDVEEKIGPVSKVLRTVGAGVVDWSSSGGVLWHKLVGVEPVGDLLAELVGLNEMVVVFFTYVKLMGALRGKGAGVSPTLWV